MEGGGLAPDGGLPEPLALSSEGLEAGGVYVLENGGEMLVYVDRDAAPQLVQVGVRWCVRVRVCGGCVCACVRVFAVCLCVCLQCVCVCVFVLCVYGSVYVCVCVCVE